MDQKRHHLQGDRAATEQLLDEYIDYLMDHSDSEHPAWNLEMIRSGKSNKWNYIDGCMITGILERYAITGEARFLDFADRFMSGFVEEDGRIRTYDPAEYSLDNVNPAKNLFTLYDLTGKEKYRKALELVRSQLSTMPRTPEGNFWHKLIYPNQVWLDGIYMALPFYMEYEKRFDAQKDCLDICRQIANVEIRMRDPKTGLYYHGYDASRKMYWADPDTGCSPNFWLRAEGWFIRGLVDVLEIMKDLPMQDESVHLQHMLLDLAKALTWKGAEKAAKLVTFANAYDLPVITVVDVTSYKNTECTESHMPTSAAKLAYAYANADVPMITVVKNALGTAGLSFGAKALGADVVYAFNNSKIGVIDAAQAAKVVADGDAEAEKKFASENTALAAAKRGYVDEIIAPEETRQRIAAALQMLGYKSVYRPDKKSGTV